MPIYTKRANKTSDFIAFLSLNRSFSIFHESEEKKNCNEYAKINCFYPI